MALGSPTRRNWPDLIRGALFAGGCLVLATTSAPVAAQLAPGNSGFSSAPTQGSHKDYWWLLREMGRCVAATKTAEAQAFLASAVDSSGEERAFDRLFHGRMNSCMRNFVSLTAPRAHIRGAVAEGLYKHLNQTDSPPAIAPQDGTIVASLRDFARCYIADNSAASHALLAETRLGTGDEGKAVQAMAGGFAPCLPQGTQVRLNPPEVRMAIAEALYHAAVGTTIERN